MRILLFQTGHFDYQASQAGSPIAVEPEHTQVRIEGAAVAFIHMEPSDESRAESLHVQSVKYFRWYLRKRALNHVVLHSFAHLAEERASAGFAKAFLDQLQKDLYKHAVQVEQTPFGWRLAWEMKVMGHGFAKTFKCL